MPEVPESSAESPRSPQEKLARRTKELEVLQRAAENLSSTLDLNEIYASALRTMGELFEFHHSIILVAEPGGTTLRVVASRGYDDQSVGGRVQVGAGVIGLVAERRKALYAGNLGQQRAYAAAQRRQMVEAGRGQELGEASGAWACGRRESVRRSTARARRVDRCVFDRESGEADVQPPRAGPRVDCGQSDCDCHPQRAPVRRARAGGRLPCRRRTHRSRSVWRNARRRSSASCAWRRNC